ncbi:AAA family ATPase [Clostridium sp. Sa3CUN1]|uniref:AAA family ATPase n=2 Tax=Clostridium TaxID=1485 RepID=A0ABR8PZL3_9CLOT|nr:AAA family ATPase [Clostridium gallinarum]MBD7913608.1 AAA family ATPase [Clostridium gallinarum]
MKKIALGQSDFKTIIEDDRYFVDKTLLIKEFLEDPSQIILIPRPRRFGKTLNLSMIRYFVEKCDEDRRHLFNNLLIEKEEDIMKRQGIYPTIYLTFKDEKHDDFNILVKRLNYYLIDIYNQFKHIYDYLKDESDKNFFRKIQSGKASKDDIEIALRKLSNYLYDYYGEKVIVLIDEYDTPIQHSYFSGIYDETIGFMRNFLSNTLKDNIYLEKAMLTGILRVARESIFSGLNNLKVNTILKNAYCDKFGFTDIEIEKVLNDFNVVEQREEFKKWYNGYIFGNTVIYNPWSVLCYLDDRDSGFMPYWVNTSENKIIKTILSKGSEALKKSFEELLRGNTIEAIIDENIVMADIELNEDNIWSFLLMAGYLKVVGKRREDIEIYYSLKIPNLEVKYMYEKIIRDWQSESYIASEYNEMLKALVNFDYEVFEEIFIDYVEKSLSYFDVSGEEPEKVYHSFVLGMLVSLNRTHYVLSNRESGYGRYDVMVIPKDINKPGIIIEFKRARKTNKKSIEELIEEARKQIEDKKYETELLNRGITNIKKLVIVFKGKEVYVNDVS